MDKPSATPSPLDMQEFPCSARTGPVAHATHPAPEVAAILHQCAGTYREMLSLGWGRATLGVVASAHDPRNDGESEGLSPSRNATRRHLGEAGWPPALLPPLAQSTAPLASIRRRRVRVVSGFEFSAVSLNAMYVRFRSGSVIAVPLHARISGVATVTDGDTLKIGPERIRLHGIDAPESAERCRAGGRTWVCGAAATRVLRSRIAGRPVECAERDRYGRIDAVCRVDGADVNAWMVAQGWTVAYRKYSTDYVSHEAAEKAARRGVWRGGIVEPSALALRGATRGSGRGWWGVSAVSRENARRSVRKHPCTSPTTTFRPWSLVPNATQIACISAPGEQALECLDAEGL